MRSGEKVANRGSHLSPNSHRSSHFLTTQPDSRKSRVPWCMGILLNSRLPTRAGDQSGNITCVSYPSLYPSWLPFSHNIQLSCFFCFKRTHIIIISAPFFPALVCIRKSLHCGSIALLPLSTGHLLREQPDGPSKEKGKDRRAARTEQASTD